ncbi:hypothetical protein ACS0TY_002528 [Phlomoides rotata]
MLINQLIVAFQDCLIQGSIHHSLLDRFRDNVKVGKIFLIRDFDVVKAMNRYRLTDHQYMIRFTRATNMEEVEEENYVISPEKFRFRSHAELLQLADKNEDLPDVIGFLISFDKASNRAVLDVFLEEEITTRLTIWDDLADSIEKKLREINDKSIIIVATCLIPKKFGGKLCLNASSGTNFYLNADFETIRDFRGRMKIQPHFDDSFKNLESNNSETQLHSIAQILNFISNENQQVKEFSCKAKVTEIILRNGWNYISCSNCARKVEKTQTTLTCNNCHDPNVVGMLRFRIEVVVDDGSGSTTFVIFDREAKKITRTTASALVIPNEEGANKDEHNQAPACILNIVGQVHKFRVKVTPYNFNTKYQSFTVSRILDDISTSEAQEPQQKENLDIEEAHGSRSTNSAKIKIEDSRNDQQDKSTTKRRKLHKKKPSLQVLEDSE